MFLTNFEWKRCSDQKLFSCLKKVAAVFFKMQQAFLYALNIGSICYRKTLFLKNVNKNGTWINIQLDKAFLCCPIRIDV